jgi:hypothetical protein
MRKAVLVAMTVLLAGCSPQQYAPFSSENECINTLEQSARGEWFTGPNLNGVKESWAAPYRGGALICGFTGNGTRFILGRDIWRHSATTGVEPLWSEYCARDRICERTTATPNEPITAPSIER